MLSEATYATSVVSCVWSLTIALIGSAGSEQSKLEACKSNQVFVWGLQIASWNRQGTVCMHLQAGDLSSRRITLEAVCDIRTRSVAVRRVEGAGPGVLANLLPG